MNSRASATYLRRLRIPLKEVSEIMSRPGSQQPAGRRSREQYSRETWTYLGGRMMVRLICISLLVPGLSQADTLSAERAPKVVQPRVENASVETTLVEGRGGKLAKAVESSKLRLMVMIGLEGTGHHFLETAYKNMFSANEELSADATDCLSMLPYFTEYSMVKTTSHYAEGAERARRDMRKMALQGEALSEPGHLAALCHFISYPTDYGPQKVMQYLDLRMLAEVAEAEGVDLRLVYMKRSARDIILANTVHRRIQHTNNPRDKNPPEAPSEDRQFIEYMRILLTDIAVVHSFLAEIDPAFIVCHDYNLSGEEAEASRIASFVAPNNAIAAMYKEAWINMWESRAKQEEVLPFEGAYVVAARLQSKLDAFEYLYCA